MKLTDICRTKWLERMEGLELVINIYEVVFNALEPIKDEPEKCWNGGFCCNG